MVFDPAVIKVSVGDTIHFKATDFAHNSVSVPNMIPNGATSWTGLLNEDISIQLDNEGIYVFQCDPHLMMAMIGVIQVGDAVNYEEIKQTSINFQKNFMMNADRLDDYLGRL
jgi:pseudoazurin